MNKIAKAIIQFASIAAIGTGLFVGNIVLYSFEGEVSTLLSPAITDTESLKVSSQKGQEMSKHIFEEGATLLYNVNNALPLNLDSEDKVNVFGWRSIDWIYGSEGQNASGGVAPEDDDISKNVDIYKALNEYGIDYNEKLYDMYHNYQQPRKQSANLRGCHISELTPLVEPHIENKEYYSDSLLSYSKEFSNVAIVSLGRMAGEGMNANPGKQVKKGPGSVDDTTRHYLEISIEEEALLKYCGQNYEKVIVLLNVANPFECGFLETIEGIDACMYLGFTGTRGVATLPKLLYGEVSPSGHTVDTFPYDMFTNPANVWLGGQSYTDYNRAYADYVEGVYVGYKWYETADTEGVFNDIENVHGKGYEGVVQFPFGHGKSYNEYEWTVGDISIAPGSEIDDNTKITFPVTVKNNGQYPGYDVVEAYVTTPYYKGQIEKPSVSLVGFIKTPLLQPGTEVTVNLELDADDFTSYDCYDKNENGHKGYELEKGDYVISLRTDSHTIKTSGETPLTYTYNVKETIKITHDKITGKPVGNLFTGEDAIDITPLDANDGDFVADIPWFTRANFLKPSEFSAAYKRRACTPSAMISGQYTAERAQAWDNATVDEFGDPVPTTPVVWGKNNGLSVTTNGVINELGQKLGADYNAPEWEKLLEQTTVNDFTTTINKYYGTKKLDSVGKPELKDLDGPAQIKGFNYAPRGTGYPTMVIVASTWNPKLAYEFGQSYGDDMKSVGVMGVWGWAVDCHRTAFFGRNHESPSEDSCLAGTIISQAVKGLHTRGRYCFIKHFALYGYGGNSIWLSEQAFRENYLKQYRDAFVVGGALGCMTTYQGIGAEHSETTIALLNGVLRKEWDFKGAITTDYIGTQAWCDSLFRATGDLGMGCAVGTLSGIKYDETSSLRVQHRMKETIKHVLYQWLRADYYERNYTPSEDETYISSTSINSWVWWKPLITSIDIAVTSVLVLWAGFVVLDTFIKLKDDEPSNDATV